MLLGRYSKTFLNVARSISTVKPKLVITQQMPKEIVSRLEKHFTVYHHNNELPIPTDVLHREAQGATAIYTLLNTKIDESLLDKAGPSLKMVATMSVGFDHIDVKACRKRGIQLGYTPGVLTDATADTNLMLILASTRRMVEATRAVRDGSWGTWKPFWMCGQGIRGHNVAVIGMGRIGLAIGQRLRPFAPKKITYVVGPCTDPAPEWATIGSFDEAIKDADFVTITCDLTPETTNMFNAETFKKMKRNAVLVNTSRGPIINMKDLYNALKTKTIAAAGLDVTVPEPLPTDHELLSLDNCIVLPHIGSADTTTRMAMANLTVDNLLNMVQGKKPKCEIP
ncbi:hypothetical protein ACOME3_001347 [Neoechinorhynchus agilis]